MPALQLYCAQDDRHRAVLLASALNKLGSACELLTERQPGLTRPILVVWTSTAASSSWLRELFVPPVEAVALALDPVALPPGCERAVALTSWPARSADANIAELARWLKSPAPIPDFGHRTVAVLNRAAGGGPAARGRDRTGTWALVVLVLLIGGFVLSVYRSPDPAERQLADSEPLIGNEPLIGIERKAPAPGTTALPSAASGRAETEALSDSPIVANPPIPADSPMPADPPGTAEPLVGLGLLPKGEIGSRPNAGDSSLAHLCRAPSEAAALAWYGVLDREQRVRAARLECVRALASTPGFERLSTLLRI